MDERLQKTSAAIAESGADWAILTSPDAVAYATGHVVPIEAGPAPFAGGPTTAIIGRNGEAGVVAANLEAGAAGDSFADFTELYVGFAFEEAADYEANYLLAIQSALKRLGAGGTIAVESVSFPNAVADMLEGNRLVSISDALNRARAVKTAKELEAMRFAAETAATGQRAFSRCDPVGRTELDVFADIRAAMENHAGARVPVTGDFLSGVARTAGFTGWPIDRRIEPGDPLMSDLAPRVNGYWGDSCASAVAGKASPAYRKLFDVAKSALTLAEELIRPGLAINELDRRLREDVSSHGFAYPHHTGHSLGTSVHEWPRVVPYETAKIESGMVLMIEPGAYDAEVGGVRTEWMFAVTDTGCEVLTKFDHAPELQS